MEKVQLKEQSPILKENEYSASNYLSIDDQIFCIHGNNLVTCCTIQKDSRIENDILLDHSECHSNSQVHEESSKARKKLITASVICLLFMVAEIIGGIFANSLAIATDAAHLLTDFASFMISLFSIWYASRPATKRMSFGYYRAEVIGALTSVLLIWVVTGILVYLAIQRLIFKNYVIEGKYMLITAVFGLVVNILMGFALHIDGVHGHSHSYSHTFENNLKKKSKSSANINVRAAFIHVLGDFLQSLGILIASLIIYFKKDWNFIDPICTFIFSVLVLLTTFTIIKDVLNVLMEGIPKGIDFLEVQRALFNISGVIKVHNLRIWSLSMNKVALSAHLAIDKNEEPTQVLKRAYFHLRSNFDIFELTIQVEEYKDEMKDCRQCQLPQ